MSKCLFFIQILAVLFLPKCGISQSLADTSLIRQYNKRLIESNYFSSYPDSIRYYAEKGLDLATKIDDTRGQADMSKHIGIYYFSKADYPKAIEYYTKAADLYEIVPDLLQTFRLQSNIGMIYNRLGNYGEAARLIFSAISRLEAQPRLDSLFIGSTYASLGVIQKNMKQYPAARQSYLRARQLLERNSDKRFRAELAGGVFINSANLFKLENKYDSALAYYLTALKIFEEVGNVRGKVTCYNNLADLAILTGAYSQGFEYAKKGYELASERKFIENQISSLIAMGGAKIRMSELAEAVKYYSEAEDLAARTRSRTNQVVIFKALADAYKEVGNVSKAFDYMEKHIAMKDSLFNRQSSESLIALRLQYDVEKKNKEIKILEQEKQYGILVRNVFIAFTVAVLLIAMLIVVNLRQRSKRDKILMLEKEARLRLEFQRELTQSQIKALQAQMNPHFIFNCLNSIDYFIQQSQPVHASEYLAKFAKLIRLFMEEITVDYTLLDKELHTLDLYLQLEQLRFGTKLNYSIQVIDLDREVILIPSMIIQPFIENAIIHGIQPLPNRKGELRIVFQGIANTVVCSISDNGVGRDHVGAAPIRKRKSFGITLSKERLKLLQPHSRIEVTDLRDEHGVAAGTRVDISFALMNQEVDVSEQFATR